MAAHNNVGHNNFHPQQGQQHSALGTHPVDLNPMDFIEQNNGGGAGAGNSHQPAFANAANPFDLDTFDVLGTFPDLESSTASASGGGHYAGSEAAAAAAGGGGPHMLHNNHPSHNTSPMLGSSPASSTASKKDNRHFHPPHITDYSPDWAWTEVSILFRVAFSRNFQVQGGNSPTTFKKIRLHFFYFK